MRKKGSVTLFFSLFLAVLLVVIQVIFRSVQIAGGKVQAETGVEEGLYSVFAGYDRELFEKYHVFFLDGGYGTGALQPGRMCQKVEDSMIRSCSPEKSFTGIRGENLWKCSKETGAVTGITLASDQQGRAFKIQAIDYMKDTAGIQGIQLLLEKTDIQGQIIRSQEKEGNIEQAKKAQESYEKAKEQAKLQSAEQVGQTETSTVSLISSGEEFVNPIEVIGELQKRGILSLVLPTNAQVSQGTFDTQGKMSLRTCEKGMGVMYFGENPDTVTGNLIFQEYMIKHLNCYGEKEETGGISYQLEYVIAGKNTDPDNLKAVITRLLAMREAANMVYLIKNPVCQVQIHEMALAICTLTGIPALESVVSLALEAVWAFGESILDLRQLLAGGKIPLVKTAESWNLSMENLGNLPWILKEKQEKQQNGLTYKEYLRVLLSLGKSEKQVLRTMDVVEQSMRSIKGKENFRMDLCVSYLKVEMGAVCRGYHFTIQRDYGYEM